MFSYSRSSRQIVALFLASGLDDLLDYAPSLTPVITNANYNRNFDCFFWASVMLEFPGKSARASQERV
jgi:hypothetical protein